MRKIYLISDTHFGHENILKFKGEDGYLREFDSVKDMDDCMVTNWNETVNDHDIVYHLGDVYFGRGHEVLPLLKGRKRLVLGNHDNAKSPHILNNFQKVMVWRMFPEYDLALTHIPMHMSEDHSAVRSGKYHYNVHGHIHDRPSPTMHHINVSCEAIGYTPVDIERIIG